MQHAMMLIIHAHYNWVIAGLHGEEPVALQSSQVPYASKFLTNLKI